ncbi:hypothetical protein [Streptomyces virginiae]|uniref:hypothetical protein n=1 Tax=Streptomyces virginiae TaxID=1961 RepID=UPI00342ED6BE
MPHTTTLPLAPMTPHTVISAFSYLRAVQAGDVEAAREFAGAEPRMAGLLVDVIERTVVPITTLPGPEAGEPSTEMIALEALGRVLVAFGRRPGRTRRRASPAPSSTSSCSSSPTPRGRGRGPAPAGGGRSGPCPRRHPAPAGAHPVHLCIV